MDGVTLDALAELYPPETRARDAQRLGYKPSMLNHIVSGIRRPKPDVAHRISAESRGRLTIARVCGWKRTTRYPGCRVFDDDPMPPARALPGEPYRVRAFDRDAVRYLEEVRADLPPDVAAAVDLVIGHLEAPTEGADQETVR